MEYCSSQFCGILLIFLCGLINAGHTLECYKCNATVSTLEDDSCKGKGSIVSCTDPAVCLSATYSLQDGGSTKKEYTTLKTCYVQMHGDECTYLLKNIKNQQPMSTKVEFTGKCYTCDEKGCNEHSNGTSASTSPWSKILLVGLISAFLVNKLI